MARGQKERAIGALQEAETADQSAISLLPRMSIETITLNLGELAWDIPYLYKPLVFISVLQSRKTN
jgi:hypothetical protein